jgi:quinol monooxygenase YgiN
MLVIVGTMNVEPSDRDALLEASKAVMAETLKEDGCHAYCFTPDINDPGVVHVVEKWESEAHLGPHLKSEHIKTFGRALKPLKVTGRDFTVYEVASEKKL